MITMSIRQPLDTLYCLLTTPVLYFTVEDVKEDTLDAGTSPPPEAKPGQHAQTQVSRTTSKYGIYFILIPSLLYKESWCIIG